MILPEITNIETLRIAKEIRKEWKINGPVPEKHLIKFEEELWLRQVELYNSKLKKEIPK